MLKRKYLLIFILLFCSVIINAFAGNDALIPIYNLQDLQNMQNNLAGHYILMQDIDAGVTKNWHCDNNKNMCLGFQPIGDGKVDAFTGSFDGNGHVIKNLYINRGQDQYVGLFGYADNAKFDYIQVSNSSIAGLYYTGGLIGYSQASSVHDSGFQGAVSGERYTGGLIGMKDAMSSVVSSSANATVQGTTYVGGLIGATDTIEKINATPTIINSYSQGSVSSKYWAGGLVGYNDAEIESCFSIGKVVSQHGGYYGGFVGRNDVYGIIHNSYWDTEASGTDIGIGDDQGSTQLVGQSTARMKTPSTFTNWNFNCIWSINNATKYPGLAWQDAAAKPITSIDDIRAANDRCLTVDAHDVYKLQNDIDLQGQEFTPIGSASDPYAAVIDGNGHTIANLKITRPTDSNVGLFGYTAKTAIIKNLKVTGSVEGGVNVGMIAGVNNGQVQGCEISNGSVKGESANAENETNIGGLVGLNLGSILESGKTDTVALFGAYDNLGGAVGKSGDEQHNLAYIDKTYSVNDLNIQLVSSGNNVGGLVGKTYGNISDSLAWGMLRYSGANNIGGLVGYIANRQAKVLRSYANMYLQANNHKATNLGLLVGNNADATLGNVMSSYYLKNGSFSSAGGEGIISSQFINYNFYQQNGWSITGDYSQRANYTWYISAFFGPELAFMRHYF